jgi:hypothetical protein
MALIAHLLPNTFIPDAAQWGAIGLTALGGFGILKRRSSALDLLSWATFAVGALGCLGMVGVAMLSPVSPGYTLSVTLNQQVTSPVQLTTCAYKPDGSLTATPDGDHVLAVLVDGVQVATASTNAFSVAVPLGVHHLRVELLTRDHREFNPVVAFDTAITVTNSAPAVGSQVCSHRSAGSAL